MFHAFFKTMMMSLGGVAVVCASAQSVPTNQSNWQGTWASVVSLGEEAKAYSNLYEACCMGPGADIPLTPQYRTIRDAFVNRTSPERDVKTNSSTCTPLGLPGVLVHPVLFELVIERKRTTMIFENGEVRRIWTDGRGHPGSNELVGSSEGDSVGTWRNGVLSVDTTDISPIAEIFMSNGIHVTDKTHVTEKFYLKDKSALVIEMTIADPEIFKSPYVYKLGFKKIEGAFPVGCDANNRDNGASKVDLTLPSP